MSTDQIVLYSGDAAGGSRASLQSGALVVRQSEAEKAAALTRMKDANELEAKLKMINDMVPTRVYNTSSSTAGAGSGDFHQYRMIRRTEQARVARIEEDWKKKTEEEEYEARKREREQQAEEKTAKNRAKRQKKKAKKPRTQGAAPAQAAKGAPQDPSKPAPGGSGGEESSSEPEGDLTVD